MLAPGIICSVAQLGQSPIKVGLGIELGSLSSLDSYSFMVLYQTKEWDTSGPLWRLTVMCTWEVKIPTVFLSFNINFSMALFRLRNWYNREDNPEGTEAHEYVLVAIDYFKKLVEVASYDKITSKHRATFIINNFISHYRVPDELINEQGSHFKMEVVSLLEKHKIQ